MNLSLKNTDAVNGGSCVSGRNGGGRSPREQEHTTLSTENPRSAQTILFIDDEPSILEVRRLVFEALGYSVLTAINGEEALEVFRLNAVDAVVLDYLMPGIDGEETARRIRKLNSDIPIVLSSGCLTLPERVLKVVTTAVEKTARPEVLIRVLKEQLNPLSNSAGRKASPSYAD